MLQYVMVVVPALSISPTASYHTRSHCTIIKPQHHAAGGLSVMFHFSNLILTFQSLSVLSMLVYRLWLHFRRESGEPTIRFSASGFGQAETRSSV